MLLVLLAGVGLVGCTSTVSGGNPDDPAGPTSVEKASALIYPAGILTDRTSLGSIRGVYPEASANANSCCWIGADAQFYVLADAGAKALHLTVYEPAVPTLASGQVLTLVDSKGKAKAAHVILPGLQSFALPLSGVVRDGTVAIRVHVAKTFVPKEAGMNGDTRHLALIVRDVIAQ